ncbi:MAG: hypothetical protein DMD35_18340, partial [Gemmatimonadetes bacterium]
MSRFLLLFATVLLLPVTAPAQTHPAAPPSRRAFTPSDWYRVTTVGAPAMSPDGRLVAFTVTTVVERENRRHSEVWVVPSDASEAAVRYTSPVVESSEPRFSADGKYLLFASKRGAARTSTWAVRLDKPSGEGFPADSMPHSGSTPQDRRFVVWSDSVPSDTSAGEDSVTRRTDPFAKMMAVARPPYGAITRPLDPSRFDGRHVLDLHYRTNDRGFLPSTTAARVWRPLQVWVQALDGSPRRQLTRDAYSHFGAVVSPDGNWIAFAADTGLRADSIVQAERDSIGRLPYERSRDERAPNEVDIFVIPTAGCEASCRPRRLTNALGSESDLAWSPDGKRLAFISQPSRTESARIYSVAVAGGAPDNLLGDWRYEPERFAWLPSGEVSFSAAVGGRTALFTLAPGTRVVRELIGGRRRLSGFARDAAQRKVAFVAT